MVPVRETDTLNYFISQTVMVNYPLRKMKFYLQFRIQELLLQSETFEYLKLLLRDYNALKRFRPNIRNRPDILHVWEQ